ncbi:MAG: hypothetical protein HY659_14815, partial [Rhizobiales bacterium]|nr:hypothetical protein [Hyphomicrobiales bacterium]
MTTISPPLALTNLFLRRASSDPSRAQRPFAGGARMGDALDKTAALFRTPNAANQNGADKAKAASVRSLIEGARNLVDLAQVSTSTLASVVGDERDLTAVPEFGIASGKIITVSDGEKTAVYTHAAANRIEDFI